ncbi:MAG: 4-hydroxy-tetrahydrodipicolinate synthase, partial [Pseudomonadota bacterium]|nr:4-hydroxy-tetrahydrodipicolinate synthase [Pseudomonadota bacterium]
VALVTPMQNNGAVDYDTVTTLLDWHIESGTDAVVVLGTTGESPTITSEERTQLIRHCVAHLAGRIPLIAGTGSNSTDLTIRHTREAMDLGVDACLIVTPYYNKPTQEGLFLHFQAVAKAVAVPQIIYNVPGRTGCDLLPETVARLIDVSNIIGLKEASPDATRITKLMALCQGKIDIFSGEDGHALDFMKGGGKGVISVTANVAPKLMHEMSFAALKGDYELAEALDAKLRGLHSALFVESNPIPVKWALHEMGKIPSGIRMPLTELTAQQFPVVRQALQQAGVI